METKLSLKKEIKQLRVQLAGCAVAALGWTKNPAKKGDYGWSPSYQDVLELRKKYDESQQKEAVIRVKKDLEKHGAKVRLLC